MDAYGEPRGSKGGNIAAVESCCIERCAVVKEGDGSRGCSGGGGGDIGGEGYRESEVDVSCAKAQRGDCRCLVDGQHSVLPGLQVVGDVGSGCGRNDWILSRLRERARGVGE